MTSANPSIRASGSSSSNHKPYDFDDALADTDNLGHLIDGIIDVMSDLDFGVGENRNHTLDRAMGMIMVAHQFNSAMSEKIGKAARP